jgi:hypothetical protein
MSAGRAMLARNSSHNPLLARRSHLLTYISTAVAAKAALRFC